MGSQGADVMLERISSQSVREATRRGWDEWLEALDAAGAGEMSHKEIVAHLAREHPAVSGWWRQAITVGYEQARGRRVTGETADAGFQVGVQRSLPLGAADAWALVTSRPDLWLGEGASVVWERGAAYEAPAVRGEVRVVKPADRLRMTWQPDGWPSPATLQLTFLERAPGKTSIGAHLERLPDAAARESMRERWRDALERIAAAATA